MEGSSAWASALDGVGGRLLRPRLVESFNATLECELIDRRAWTIKAEARLEVFYRIKAIYNRTRRHSAVGYLSPVDYETMLSITPATSNPST